MSTADPLTRVRQAVADQQSATERRDQAMRDARDAGATWQAIADAAGMTPHGVRYALGYKRE